MSMHPQVILMCGRLIENISSRGRVGRSAMERRVGKNRGWEVERRDGRETRGFMKLSRRVQVVEAVNY